MTALLDTYAQYPLDIVGGRGGRLTARDGRQYWDFYGGHAVCGLGHSHEGVADALAKQARSLAFYSNVLPLDIRTKAAERLCAFAPPGLDCVFFCNSGAEANENALKLAIQQTGRRRLASLVGGWHGRSILCLSVTDDPKITTPYQPLLAECVRIRPNSLSDINAIDESVAAVIVEPIQSIAGIVELDCDFVRAIRARCDMTGTMLIYDEVQTGMGRLGRPFAAGEFGVMPDMITLAKSLANGVPMGAVLVSPRIAAKVKSGDLGSTFGGGPLACAAMLAVLDAIEADDLVEHAQLLGDAICERLVVGPVEGVMGRGCLIGLRTRIPAKDVHSQLMKRGFITGTSGNPHVLRLMPPLNMPMAAVDELALALAKIGDPADAALAHLA